VLNQLFSQGLVMVLGSLFGLIGIVLAIVGFKLFDLVIKADVENEICQNKNLAAGVLGAAVILGVSIIVAATILS